ncbi:Short-chain dehydrogenase [Pseudozyma hubeiensis]|nr:Short-chain dehydrogenase [Pseudozyma hubeiensis]
MASYTSIIREMILPSSSSRPSSSKPHWDPNTSMAPLPDRIVIITGPTSGIGYETLRQLVLSSAHVYLFGRSLSRLEHTRSTLERECTETLASLPKTSSRYGATPGKMDLIQCDLSDLSSIKRAVEEFCQKESRVDLVFGNAGVMTGGKTAQGYEQMWGTNVLGHHALLRLLLPALRESSTTRNSIQTGETRIILTASDTHRWVNKPIHLTLTDDASNSALGHIHLYGRSKLGNVYTTSHLSQISTRENWGLTVCSVHPGGVKSQLGSSNRLLTGFKNLFLVPATLGAVTQLWGGTGAAAEEVSGKYLVPYARVGRESDLARDEKVRADVWTWCEQQCVKHGLIAQKDMIA